VSSFYNYKLKKRIISKLGEVTHTLHRQLRKTTQNYKISCAHMQRDKWDLMHTLHQIQQLFAQHVPLEYPVNKKTPRRRKKKKSKLSGVKTI
jgi:hypothetical protein